MSNPIWPTHPDGTNKTMGEMTPVERDIQTRASLARLKGELECPALLTALKDAESRLRGAGMLGGPDDLICAAVVALEG